MGWGGGGQGGVRGVQEGRFAGGGGSGGSGGRTPLTNTATSQAPLEAPPKGTLPLRGVGREHDANWRAKYALQSGMVEPDRAADPFSGRLSVCAQHGIKEVTKQPHALDGVIDGRARKEGGVRREEGGWVGVG